MTAETILAELDRLIGAAAPEELPGLLGALAAAEATAWARMMRMMRPAPASQDRDERPVEGKDFGLLTYREAASWLRVSESYVETLVRQGKLPAITLPGTDKGTGEHRKQRQGRRKRITLSALQALRT